jgi:repressor LexA
LFKDIFVDLLQDRSLSAYRVAKDTGIPQTIVYEWTYGVREPAQLDHLTKLADYLNCSVDYLLGRTDVPGINRTPKED